MLVPLGRKSWMLITSRLALSITQRDTKAPAWPWARAIPLSLVSSWFISSVKLPSPLSTAHAVGDAHHAVAVHLIAHREQGGELHLGIAEGDVGPPEQGQIDCTTMDVSSF
jgi:hypothetical protein